MTKKKFLLLEPPINTHTHTQTHKKVYGVHTSGHERRLWRDIEMEPKQNQTTKKRDGRKKGERAAIEEVVVVVVFLLSS
jgi:hypothetical protein